MQHWPLPKRRGPFFARVAFAPARDAGTAQQWTGVRTVRIKMVRREWWAMQGLNLRPLPCEGSALPLS